MSRYAFGDKALSGFVRQKINADGELCYKGSFYLFGSKAPIYLSIEPMDKFVKGEKAYKVFTYMLPVDKQMTSGWAKVPLGVASRQRMAAIRKVKEIVKQLGVVYEYKQINEEKIQKKVCKKCIKAKNAEWENRLRETVASHVERQRAIYERKIQRLLAHGKRVKRKTN
jgi:predicted transcriptional regulator